MAANQPASESGSGRQHRASTKPTDEPKAPGNARVDGEPVEVTAARGDEPEVQVDITVLDGDAGRRLAALQAEVILDVLTWLHDQRHGAPSS